jgi:hypothetical protein
MIAGPYSVCRTDETEESDGMTFESLKWGYDSEAEAAADLVAVAEDYGVDAADLVVIRLIDSAFEQFVD